MADKLPMETVDSSETFRCHGVDYIRTGQCNRCGACEKDNCPHLSWKEGLATCDMQLQKHEVCTSCSSNEDAYFFKAGRDVTHQICVDFPNHPFLRVIKEGICGYKFEPATEEDKVKHQKLIDAWA